MLSGLGLDEYTVEGEAIRRFSSPLEQIDWMLASLQARRITFERAREIAQAEFDVAGTERDAARSRRAQRHWFNACGFFRSYPARRSINVNFPEVIFQCLSKPSDFLPP
jgi:hypothetical protein